MSKSVKLHELMNICVHLSQRATNLLQQVQYESSLNIVQKGKNPDDVYTKIDTQIQRTIHYNISQLYPKARIICEEDEASIGIDVQPSIMPDELLKIKSKQRIFTADILHNSAVLRRFSYLKHLEELVTLNSEFSEAEDVKRGLNDVYNNEVEESDLTFWIDPLDGSKGLVEGHTEHITTIIGVCIKNRPLLGVVHKPFSGDSLSFQSGKSFVGLPQSGLFTVLQKIQTDFENYENYTLYVPPFSKDENLDQITYQPKICASRNRNQDCMDRIIFSTNPQKVDRIAGSANKFVHMVDNHQDYYINFVPGFKFWDMCGSEAILASRFGTVTDSKKRPIFYDSEVPPTLGHGIIASKNNKIYKICERRIEEFTRQSLETNYEVISDKVKESRRLRQMMRDLDKPPSIQELVIN